VQAYAEHQEYDADLGEFVGEALVGDEAGRERANDNTGQQIADDGRDLEAVGYETQDKGKTDTRGDGGKERGMVGHRPRKLERVDGVLAILGLQVFAAATTKNFARR
jgi:hypothetical protein